MMQIYNKLNYLLILEYIVFSAVAAVIVVGGGRRGGVGVVVTVRVECFRTVCVCVSLCVC